MFVKYNRLGRQRGHTKSKGHLTLLKWHVSQKKTKELTLDTTAGKGGAFATCIIHISMLYYAFMYYLV